MDRERQIIELEERVTALEHMLNCRTIEPDRLYTPQEAAERLTCGKTNVYDLMNRGELAATRIGAGHKGLRVRGSDLNAFLDARTEGGPSPRSTYRHLKKYLN